MKAFQGSAQQETLTEREMREREFVQHVEQMQAQGYRYLGSAGEFGYIRSQDLQEYLDKWRNR